MDIDNGLTDKQIRFCQEYIIDLNGTQAAIRAGYSQDTARQLASQLLTNINVLKYTKEILYERAERTKVTADYVVVRLKQLAERCMQAVPVMYYDKTDKEYKQKEVMIDDGNGGLKSEGVWEFDSSGANKALETLARHLKLLTDKVDVNVDAHISITHLNGDALINEARRVGVNLPIEIERRVNADKINTN